MIEVLTAQTWCGAEFDPGRTGMASIPSASPKRFTSFSQLIENN
jgi:hypothetical protein